MLSQPPKLWVSGDRQPSIVCHSLPSSAVYQSARLWSRRWVHTTETWRYTLMPWTSTTHTHTHTRTHTHMHTHAHARTHAHTHARTHARVHTHAHTHAHTHRRPCLRSHWGSCQSRRWRKWDWSTTTLMSTEQPLSCHNSSRKYVISHSLASSVCCTVHGLAVGLNVDKNIILTLMSVPCCLVCPRVLERVSVIVLEHIYPDAAGMRQPSWCDVFTCRHSVWRFMKNNLSRF